MDQETDHSSLSRRALLRLGAATGAAGVGALGLPALASAASAPPATGWKPAAPGSTLRATPHAPVPPNAVQNVVGIGGWAAYNGDLTPVDPAGQYSSGAGGFMVAALDVPAGASLVALAAFGTSTSGQTWTLFIHDVLGNTFNTVQMQTSPAGVNQFAVFNVSPSPLPIYRRWGVLVTPSGDMNNIVQGVGYFYVPASPSFHVISPGRAYDSRLTGGPISNGQTRTISVATTTGGAALVPSNASAVAYNLTVVNTVAQGFLGLFPAGTAWPGTSSINWFTGGEIDANGGIVGLGGDRQVSVFCGGGSTDFVVDVTGYFL
jgi:hypothetical protein